eukprot:1195364-Prorocentrum_minimum.AAC.3
MSLSTVSSPLRTTCTVSVPSQLMVPADTVSPVTLVTGRGSPVNAASSTLDRPRTTTPSTATRSPGKICNSDSSVTVSFPTGALLTGALLTPYYHRGRSKAVYEGHKRPKRGVTNVVNTQDSQEQTLGRGFIGQV